MKRSTRRFLFEGVLLGLMVLLFPVFSGAMTTIDLGEESEVTFYGFFRNNLGMFLDEQPFAQSGNDLATARTWFRGYTDYRINEKFKFWAAVQFVYEPEYDVEDGATSSRVPPQFARETKDWKEYSEYDNINDILREFYVKWIPSSKHDIKIGRQIAIWGEALTSRVGDVVHPDDSRFTLAFSNLEDTRIPSWMIRGIHDIPSLSSTFEWIYNPNLVQNIYTVNRSGNFSTNGAPGQRFGIYPETRFDAPLSVRNPALGGPFMDPNVVVPHPFSRDWIEAGPGFWVPTALPSVKEEYPSGWWDDARGGFRTTTYLEGYTFGVSYFRTQNYNPVVKRGRLTGGFDPVTGVPFRQYTLSHLNMDIFGIYMNKQLTGSIPGVIRSEAIYVPNHPFNTFDTSDADAIVRRDYVKYLIAWDLSDLLYFQWHKTAAFDIVFEHVGEWLPRNQDIQYATYSTEQNEWNPQFNISITTEWFYNLFSTTLIASYIPWGDSGLIMPTVKYTPAWFNEKFSFELRYINVFASTPYEGMGLLETKDMLILTSQFNW